MLSLYTDGSCLDNKNGMFCGWAWCLVDGDIVLKEDSGGHARGTNNTGEMAAIIHGLEHLSTLKLSPDDRYVEILSDSQYCIKGITDWINKWKRKGWINHSGDPVKNEGLWRKMDKLTEDLRRAGWSVNYRHVKGHSGIVFNERVDKLAGEAAEPYRKAYKEGLSSL